MIPMFFSGASTYQVWIQRHCYPEDLRSVTIQEELVVSAAGKKKHRLRRLQAAIGKDEGWWWSMMVDDGWWGLMMVDVWTFTWGCMNKHADFDQWTLVDVKTGVCRPSLHIACVDDSGSPKLLGCSQTSKQEMMPRSCGQLWLKQRALMMLESST